MDKVELAIFERRLAAVCDEMGAVLARAAFSPNIKDRLDYSCAVFDAGGRLAAQAAHIPVHLGSMAQAMASVVETTDWRPGDVLVFNDPYLGGTHLPDVTVVSPVFVGGAKVGFVASRAHHADIGARVPGSMPLARHLDEEGVIIPPGKLVRGGVLDEGMWREILADLGDPDLAAGDFQAQMAANRVGAARLAELVEALGAARYLEGLGELNAYAGRLASAAIARIPEGRYTFTDHLDDDGFGHTDIPIAVTVDIGDGRAVVDFTGTAGQVEGNLNCPLAVTAAAVFYVFRCLMPEQTPACHGAFAPIELRAPEGCLVNARRPAACGAGNVETSQRIVDALLGALAPALPEAIPAASQGTMNNVAMGGTGEGGRWSYYETLGGGAGAGPQGHGASAIHCHMTNTLNTPIESLELHYPLRVLRYQIRRGSGGLGRHRGGDGLVREYQFLAPAQVTLIGERRRRGPWGLKGGEAGKPGQDLLNGDPLPGKARFQARAGDRLTIETPGGGGWGEPYPVA